MASIARSRSTAESVCRTAQRPALCRGRGVRPLPCPARRLGSISERRLSKPSAVTSPAATSSQSPVSTSAFSLSGAAHNVCEERCSALTQVIRTPARATGLSPPSIARCAVLGVIQSASSRTKNVMGATLVGITRRRPFPSEASRVAGCGDKRPQPTAPVRQS